MRFLRTGGPAMPRMMNIPEEEMAPRDHAMAPEHQQHAGMRGRDGDPAEIQAGRSQHDGEPAAPRPSSGEHES